MAALHFVVSTNIERADPELRKLIRSHVMVGKNKGKTRPRRKRDGKVQAIGEPAVSISDTSPKTSSTTGGDSAILSISSRTTVLHPMFPVTIPRKFGSELTAIRFPGGVEPQQVEVVLQLSAVATKLMFPLEQCLLFEGRAEEWVAPLVRDPAYLHAMIFMSQFYFDIIVPRKLDSNAADRRTMPHYLHYLKTIRILRERLATDDDGQTRLSNATAAAIMGLAAHAHLTDNARTSRHHMEGLYKIINLRGGISSFKDNIKLLVEIFSCDLAMALDNSSTPVFFKNSDNPFLPFPDLTMFTRQQYPHQTETVYGLTSLLPADTDESLVEVWNVTSAFCTMINLAVDSGQLISMSIFLDTMASVMYRLINLRDRFEVGSRNDAICLGLLAFSASVFLPWKRFGVAYRNLATIFKACFASLSLSSSDSRSPPQLLVWLLMMGAVAIFEESDDAWLLSMLSQNMGLCGIDSWSKMQEVLKAFMWIDLVHGKRGKEVFDANTRLSRLNPD